MICDGWLRFAPVFWRSLGRLPLAHLVYLARMMRFEYPHCFGGRMWVNTFFPAYPSRAFDRFLEAVYNRWRVPYSVYFAVTDQCPYRCGHCSYGRHQPGQLGTDLALEAIRQIKSIGAITIGLTGGEPLVRDDLARLVGAIGPDTGSVLFTTGWRLDEQRACELAGAGLDAVLIGLESDDEREHDRVRGVAGSHKEALKALEAALGAGLYAGFSTIATRDKLQQGVLERLARLAERIGARELRILEPVATGGWSGQEGEMLTEVESQLIVRFHQEWNRRRRGPAIASFSHLESDRLFGCGAGFHHLFVDALGQVCPCDLTPLSLGNLLEEPLAEIWERMGRWFGLPRCGCLMKELGELDQKLEGALPLERCQSEAICGKLAQDGQLPGVYARLFKGRKPTSRPTIRG